MNDTVISVENLSKRYLIGRCTSRLDGRGTFRDALVANVRNAMSKTVDTVRGRQLIAGDRIDEFWALDNINFEVKRGEVVGILGRNGAGKSTLLKILSRITEPTAGRVHLRGRIASLLEVGTGFHPELSGRENIFLNGAILGMSRAEIRAKFDEIVSFAEVEQFIDTPVKRYSSGMYLRLAFSVAAHLSPEILLVDEVLAVGDLEFQNKCLGKLEAVSTKEERTVVFVSHNMAAISGLCKRGIFIDRGKISFAGDVREAIDRYASSHDLSSSVHFQGDPTKPSILSVSIDQAALADGDLIVDIAFSSPFPLRPVPGALVKSSLGIAILDTDTRIHPTEYNPESTNSGVLKLVARQIPLVSGRYFVSVWLSDWQTDYDHKDTVISFDFPRMRNSTSKTTGCGLLDLDARWFLAQDTLVLPPAG
jgi:lipopolysaccharide transport system ATP-binding protein